MFYTINFQGNVWDSQFSIVVKAAGSKLVRHKATWITMSQSHTLSPGKEAMINHI